MEQCISDVTLLFALCCVQRRFSSNIEVAESLIQVGAKTHNVLNKRIVFSVVKCNKKLQILPNKKKTKKRKNLAKPTVFYVFSEPK